LALVSVPEGMKGIADFICNMVRVCDNIENTACELHDAERMFKPLVSGAWIHKVCQCQLVNVPQSLKRTRVEDFAFVVVQPNEHVDWISDLVDILRHC
jgi:hypothetical protein